AGFTARARRAGGEDGMGKGTRTVLRSAAVVAATVSLVGCASTGALAPGLAARGNGLEIRTLSSRPDLVSGGDALVEIRTADGVDLAAATVSLNGADVTDRLS